MALSGGIVLVMAFTLTSSNSNAVRGGSQASIGPVTA